MLYLVTHYDEASSLGVMDEEDLRIAKKRIAEAMGQGIIRAAYAFVGGGALWIVDAENNATLARGLRKLGVTKAEVTPLVDMMRLIDGYIEYRQSEVAQS